MTKASVVILTRNSEDWLIDVLESVSAQTCPRDWLETIIVDRGSTDATTALARFYMARHGHEGWPTRGRPGNGSGGCNERRLANRRWGLDSSHKISRTLGARQD
jgi:glycosyltransferase involved in cell wall biosynthesis